ncbi:MAG: TonB-dependent receptor [Bacteroidales bacterium]|nr:TonB-dependent receptor [Bacteroidales bacterium]
MFKHIEKVLLLITLSAIGVNLHAQVVKGAVIDAEGAPLPGVSVLIEGTSSGTVTGADGTYQLSVQGRKGPVLQFSMIGMKTIYEPVNGRKTVNVEMGEDTSFLDEVVVVGYQEMKRKDLLGSVSSVSSNKLLEQPVNSVGTSLAGRMAGVSVVTTEGDPDPVIKIRVRGTGSITQSSEPLYIIDGFPANDLSDISASQIQSIDVLKDAFATAIYGSRGANGVVIVTTKGAQGAGKVSVNLNAYYGLKTMANKDAYTPLNAQEFIKLQYERSIVLSDSHTVAQAYTNYFGTFDDIYLFDGIPTNDYMEMLFGNTASNYNVDMSVSGRNKLGNWSLTLARLGEEGIMTGTSFNRTNVGFKGNLRTGKKTSVDVNFRYSNANERGTAANNIGDVGFSAMNGRVNQALVYSPIPVHVNILDQADEDTFFEYRVHPLRSLADNDRQINRTWLNMNAAFNWDIVKNLRFKAEFGYGVRTTTQDNYVGTSTYWSNIQATMKGLPGNRHYEYWQQRFRNATTLSYDFKDVMDPQKHKLNIIVGEEINYANAKDLTIMTEGFPDFFTAEDTWNFMASGTPFSNSRNIGQPDAMLSFFGRANYTLLDRYSVGATLRADGSSRFGPGHRWGIFPSVAVSWDIANEPFMKNVGWIDQLKFRYSYGTAGNNNIPSGQIYALYSASTTAQLADLNSVWNPSSNMPNPALTWETAITQNVGLDFSFLGSRINGSIDYYDNRTKDLLIQFPIGGTGYKNQYQNRASIRNHGVEFTINLPIIHKKDFDLNLSGNIAYNINKVLDLGGLDEIQATTGWASSHISYDYKVTKGESLGSVYGYQVEGIWQVEDFDYIDGKWVVKQGLVSQSDVLGAKYFLPGSIKLKNQNDDLVINSDDMVKIGNTLPDFTGGFSINAYLYGFDLSANFNYMVGNDIYNANRLRFTNISGWSFINVSDEVSLDKRWTSIDWQTGNMFTDPVAYAEANKDATMWSPVMQKAIVTDYGIEDGSFLRLQSLTLGYSLPAKLINKLHLTKFRIYATGTNLFCLTKYSGYDPEVDCRRSALTPGCDFSAYPKAIGGVLGVNIGF